MTSISPNRNALKSLSSFTIDAQFCQQYGTQVFNYSGDVTSHYQQICSTFSSILQDLLADIQELQRQIPLVQKD